MYTIVIVGGGKIKENQNICSMPIGDALARFELHWDEGESKNEELFNGFTGKVYDMFTSNEDSVPERVYRGDIWLEEQAQDPRLDAILKKYDRR